MSESERRRKYRYDRVLIETDRILDPQFDDAVVFLSGAQIEMLRNVTQYLNRLDTYVSEHFLGYYLAPTSDDYDDILEIVAELEEALMGNPNTLWGYKDRLSLIAQHTKSGNGDHVLWVCTVPEGYVYEINLLVSRNSTTAVNQGHYLWDGGASQEIAVFATPPAGTWSKSLNTHYRLKEGDRLRVDFTACLDGDDLRGRAWGYSMEVPA